MIFLRSALNLNRSATRQPGRVRSLTVLVMLLLLFTSLNVEAVSAATIQDSGSTWLKLKAGEYRPGQVVVKFRDPAGGKRANNKDLQPQRLLNDALVEPYHIDRFDTFPNLPGFARYFTSDSTDLAQLITAMSLNSEVESVEPNYIYKIARGTNDPLYNQASNPSDPNTYRQWYLKKINIEPLWDVTQGNNQVIAVVDTGINPYHEDLIGKVDQTHSYNFINGYAPGAIDPNKSIPNWDDNGHGTFVAGIIAGNSNNGLGIAGINWQATLLSVKVLGADGSGDSTTVSNGIVYAADNQARIVNLSLGSNKDSFITAYAVQYAINKGVLVVAASGNSSEIVRPSFPAAYRGVLAVGATDRQDKITDFSNTASYISVVAPGVDIFSTSCYFINPALRRTNSGTTGPNNADLYIDQGCPIPDKYKSQLAVTPTTPTVPGQTTPRTTSLIDPCILNDTTSCFRNYATDSMYAYEDGTSFSAPIVAGLASLIVAVKPDASNDLIRLLLESTATDIGPAGRDNYSGYGRVDAGALAKALSSGDFSPNRRSILQGIVTGANPNDVIVNLDPPNTNKTLDLSNAGFRFEQLGAGVYQLRLAIPKRGIVLGPVALYPNGQSGNVISVNFDVASGTIICGPGAVCPGNQNGAPGQTFTPPPPPPSNSAPSSVYFNPSAPLTGLAFFQETTHNLGGSFRAYWESHGGLAIFGYPISEEFSEVSATDGKTYTVQYFQRNRFEFHPENNEANRVLLGLLGSELTTGRSFPPGAPVPNTPTIQYFPATQHSLSGRFLDYWNKNGGLAIFGYPISEPIQEGPFLVQYFERNRFELHPENQAPYDVLLGLLGTDLARNRNYIR